MTPTSFSRARAADRRGYTSLQRCSPIGRIEDPLATLARRVRRRLRRTEAAEHLTVWVSDGDVYASASHIPAGEYVLRTAPDAVVGVYTRDADVPDIAADLGFWRDSAAAPSKGLVA